MTPLDHVYYFPIDAEGNDIGDPIKIGLNADGSADLSELPKNMKETLEAFGAPDEFRHHRLLPKDGKRFLAALLRLTNGYVRFRGSNKIV